MYRSEESLNAATHGLGLLFALIALPLLINGSFEDKPLHVFWAVSIYSTCFFLLYFASTIYHAVQNPFWKKFWQRIDHMAIFFKIAGTYTPFVIGYVDGTAQSLFLGSLWSLVLIGCVFKWYYAGRYDNLSITLYVFMGCMIIFKLDTFLECMPEFILWPILLGGLFYLAGIYFYKNDHRKYYHSIWHLFSLAGSVFHYWAVASML